MKPFPFQTLEVPTDPNGRRDRDPRSKHNLSGHLENLRF